MGPNNPDDKILLNNWNDVNNRTWSDIAVCIRVILCSQHVYKSKDNNGRDIFIAKVEYLTTNNIDLLIVDPRCLSQQNINTFIELSKISKTRASVRDINYPSIESSFIRHNDCKSDHSLLVNYCNSSEKIQKIQVVDTCIIS
jgi:hypothetical protein